MPNDPFSHAALKTLPEEAFRLLLRNSISPLPLHKVLVLLDFISQESDEQIREKEMLAVAKTIVAEAST